MIYADWQSPEKRKISQYRKGMINLNIGAVKIPKERVAILIGKDGKTKREIEKKGEVKLEIDSDEGEVFIDQKGDALKASTSLKVVQAIGRGFNPKKAASLYNDNIELNVISLREFAKPGSHRIEEIRGRLIGRGGRTREIIEDLTSTYVSVYGDTVSIIGDYLSIGYSREALMMIIQGRKQRTVYNYLEGVARDLRVKRIEETFG